MKKKRGRPKKNQPQIAEQKQETELIGKALLELAARLKAEPSDLIEFLEANYREGAKISAKAAPKTFDGPKLPPSTNDEYDPFKNPLFNKKMVKKEEEKIKTT